MRSLRVRVLADLPIACECRAAAIAPHRLRIAQGQRKCGQHGLQPSAPCGRQALRPTDRRSRDAASSAGARPTPPIPPRSRGRLVRRAGLADAQRVPARPRPDHPLDRLPPAEAQDAGLRLPRGRPLPHAPDPHASRWRRSPARSPARWGSTRIWPRRWRCRTTSATRPSAIPARMRSTPAWRTTAASTTTPRRCAS